MEYDHQFEKVMDHISLLLNSADVHHDVQKLLALEMTTNPDGVNLEYIELLHIVVLRLAQFYNDENLENLWYNYLEGQDGESKVA